MPVIPRESIESMISLRTSKRARRMALRLDPKERVIQLVVPQRANIKKAWAFAEDHREWIEQTLSSLPPLVRFENRAVVPVLGQDRTVRITYDMTLKRTCILLNNNEISILTNKHDPSARIRRHLISLAQETFDKLAHEKAQTIGLAPMSVRVRDTKSRWGSCSDDGRLSFSWRLIFAPACAMDYVIAHEVAHLKHMNHSRAFWNLCRQLSDNYLEGRHWMQNNAHELMRYAA